MMCEATSKTTALAFAVDDTRDFIGRAGYALSHSYKTDIIVEYFIARENRYLHHQRDAFGIRSAFAQLVKCRMIGDLTPLCFRYNKTILNKDQSDVEGITLNYGIMEEANHNVHCCSVSLYARWKDKIDEVCAAVAGIAVTTTDKVYPSII